MMGCKRNYVCCDPPSYSTSIALLHGHGFLIVGEQNHGPACGECDGPTPSCYCGLSAGRRAVERSMFMFRDQPQDVPCCTEQTCGRSYPSRACGSGDADGDRASKLQHAVERMNGDVHLGRPGLIRARVHPPPLTCLNLPIAALTRACFAGHHAHRWRFRGGSRPAGACRLCRHPPGSRC